MQKDLIALSEDDKVREYMRQREKAERDYDSSMYNAKMQDLAQGVAKGRAEGEANMIAKMKASGMTDSEIQKILNI